MNRLADRGICERAVEEMDRKIQENKSRVAVELRRLGLTHGAYDNWRAWRACPGAFTLVMKEAKAWWKELLEAREDAEKALEGMKNDK